MDLTHRVTVTVLMLLAAFAGVAQSRHRKHLPILTAETMLYTFAGAVITVLILKMLGLLPWQ